MASVPVPVVLTKRIEEATVLHDRGPHTSEAELESTFTNLGEGDFRDATIFLGSFDGNAGWERHLAGDEIVQILAGETELDVIADDEFSTLELKAGMLVVMPRGCWHRFRSQAGVTVMTATPRGDEEHAHVDDPRNL